MFGRTKSLIGHSLLVAFGIAVCAGAASAQTPTGTTRSAGSSAGSMTFGVMGGLSIANVSLPLGDLPPEFTDLGLTITNGRRAGFMGGLFVTSPAVGRIALETGTLISVKGTSLNVTIP